MTQHLTWRFCGSSAADNDMLVKVLQTSVDHEKSLGHVESSPSRSTHG
jgi:hypothetical protein